MDKVLIKGGRIVTAVDDYVADILCVSGRIDAHVHRETPMGNGIETCDSFESGTQSAAFGGTTAIVDFAQQFKGESPKAALDRRLAAAEPQCCVDCGFHAILTDVTDAALSELPDLANLEGVSSFKLYMAYPGVLMVDIVIFDPDKTHTLSSNTHHSNVGYSLFEGREVTGKVQKVFLRGELIVDGDTWLGRAGMGLYRSRSASGRIL